MKRGMESIKGCYTISSIIFKDDYSVDYNATASLIEFLANKTGAQGVSLFGMVSEWHKLDDYERRILSGLFLEIMARAPSSSNLFVTDWSTEKAVARAKDYEQMGVDSLTLCPPFYFSPSVSDICSHIEKVLLAVDIPVLIQYAPQVTGSFLPNETLQYIANTYPNAAFKPEYKPAYQFNKDLLDLCPGIIILTGFAGLEMLDMYKIGVRGVMPACSYTELYVEIYKRFVDGDLAGAQQLYDRLEPYLKAWMVTPESLLAIEKRILQRRGLAPNAVCRHPSYVVTAENESEIDAFLKEFSDILVK